MELEWEQNPPEKPMSWYEAIEYAKSLGKGWRLPTEEELKEAYDNNVEGGFQSFNYWSSSTYAQDAIYAWDVGFGNGSVGYNGNTGGNYVRCVREVI